MTSKPLENSGGIFQIVSKIGIKLPMIMSFLVIATILVIVTSNSLLNERVIARAAGERLESISVLKTKRVESLLETIDRDLRLRAEDPGTRTALIAFTDGYQSLDDPTDVLKRVYITENEHPLGEKDKLVSADTGSSYGFIHSVYHPALDHLQDEMGYYDIFLIDADGNLVYSVFKENDYATNLIDGPWKDSGLADAFRGAMLSNEADSAVFIDFAPYEPSNFAPAAFISRPIFDDAGNRLGALVYQMPIEQLNKSINDLEGLGDTADGFLVGSDLLMRTDSLLSDEDDVLQTTQDIVAVRSGLAGEHGLIDYVSPSGRDVLAFYRPIEFLGVTWVSIVQQDKAVLFSGLPWALKRLGAIALTTALIIMAISIFFSRSISLPIQKLTGAVRQIAGGTYDVDVPEMGRSDELGELARATNVFKQNSIEMAKLNEEQEAASKKMATMAEEQELARQREAEMAKEKEELDRKTAETREAMLVDLGKSFGTVVEAAVGGEFSKRVEAKFSDAVLNELAEGVNKLLSTVDQGLSETGQVLARISSGDLTEPMEGDFHGAFGQLQGNVNNMMDALKVLITEISGSGNTLASSSAELRDTAGILSSQAEQNAASLEETSSALDQLSESVRQVSINVSDASKNAQTARDTAQSSEKVAADAATSMVSITEASQEIGRVIGVIEDIAFQINLLALNAGVEAARAGSAGRGFSVVASEVRQLAQRASDASKEIATVITTSDAAVSEGVRKVAGAQESLEEIAKSVINISVGVEKVSTAISEQVAVINEITSAVGQIDQNTQKQAASLEEVTGASGLLANEADGLRQSTARFDTGENRNVESIQQRARAS